MREWRKDALCQGKHGDLWFPPFSDERTVPEHRYTDIAKMVCEHCPIRGECQVEGLNEAYGVWGGTDSSNRKVATLPPFRLMERYIDRVIPARSSAPLDITVVWNKVKRYSDKRA